MMVVLAEHRCGTAIRRVPRQDIVLCTKVGRWMDPFHGPDNGSGFVGGQPHRAVVDYSYDGTMRSVEQPLLRLSTSLQSCPPWYGYKRSHVDLY
jgi:D-threo-aldose 1-dehydrogenase